MMNWIESYWLELLIVEMITVEMITVVIICRFFGVSKEQNEVDVDNSDLK